IQDWCISRQLWWGHRIPAFYDKAGNIYVAGDEEAARRKYNLAQDMSLTQDDDVLDTWFSSALWTFSTLGWPDDTEALKRYHPTSVLVTGFDIIFFWVARMIMMTLKFTGQIPFKTVYVHGLVRDAEGQKMSKSKGNVLDPIDLIDGISLEDLVEKRIGALMQPKMKQTIEKACRHQFPNGLQSYGTDALRFTFCSLASTGRDINFDVGRIEGYRNFCNKLWNATRFVMMKIDGHTLSHLDVSGMTVFDRWIGSSLQATESKVAGAIESYRLDLASQAIYEFVWNEYCDWYLELTKPILAEGGANSETQNATRCTLAGVLETILRLAHPLMPYITEELWQQIAPLIGRGGDTISKAPYPVHDAGKVDTSAEADVDWMKSVIVAVRAIRGEMNLSPARAIPMILTGGTDDDRDRLARLETLIIPLAKLSEVRFIDTGESIPASSTQLIGQLEIRVPMAGLIDVDSEVRRLDKLVRKLESDIQGLRGKLSNPGFIDKAPESVVERERGRLAEAERQLAKISVTVIELKSG
ncbi:MAG TPA: valine--tRNA ligase, partial [Gammaproteobacteria bacterium]|nr:valine--tRNA ligase [Gammaproteobacteria bacterium]